MKYLKQFGIILMVSLLGEFLRYLIPLTIPASIYGIVIMFLVSKAGLNKDQQKAEKILRDAQMDADAKIKQAVLDGKTQAHELRVEAEKEIKEKKQEAAV